MPTPKGDYAATLQAITDLVAKAEADIGGIGTVGVGIPGTISPATGLVKNANSTWLNGKPLLADLQLKLAREVRVQNDANCFAVSESLDGAGQGFPVVAGIILGTGCGCGIAIEGCLRNFPRMGHGTRAASAVVGLLACGMAVDALCRILGAS